MSVYEEPCEFQYYFLGTYNAPGLTSREPLIQLLLSGVYYPKSRP